MMLGRLLATLYASARRVSATPKAKAMAATRRKPVIRDAAVPTDITAVLRTSAWASASSSRAAASPGRGPAGSSPESSGPGGPSSAEEEPPSPPGRQEEGGADGHHQRHPVVRCGPDHDLGLGDRQAPRGRLDQYLHGELPGGLGPDGEREPLEWPVQGDLPAGPPDELQPGGPEDDPDPHGVLGLAADGHREGTSPGGQGDRGGRGSGDLGELPVHRPAC